MPFSGMPPACPNGECGGIGVPLSAVDREAGCPACRVSGRKAMRGSDLRCIPRTGLFLVIRLLTLIPEFMKKIIACLAAGAFCLAAGAQEIAPDSLAAAPETEKSEHEGALDKYRRSSLYTVLIRHPEAKYGEAIDSAFLSIPVPDKFNDHDLALKSFDAEQAPRQRKGKVRDDYNLQTIDRFVSENDIPRAMIAKWFNRDAAQGTFDMSLVQERGNYDASQLDIRLADQSTLGRATLADAGEELIGKTFLLVNDITFVDKGEKSAKAGGWLRMLGAIAGAATGTDVSSLTDSAAALVNEIDGFSVNITSYLYRLEWNDEVAGTFYQQYWTDASAPDAQRIAAFDTTSLFKVSYVGKTMTSAGNLASKSFAKSKESQMLKVCTRAIDKSIVQLQRDYDEFKVNVPLYRINEDGTVDVQIGLKEGLNARSQFDVLIPVEGENGRTTYDKVGKIQPVEGRIWDNRFGADEEAAGLAAESGSGKATKETARKATDDEPLGNVSLDATTFKVLSGKGKIVPGCLVREVTIKRDK